jgi:hypothetical protein
MDPRQEARAIESLDMAIEDLSSLKPLLLTILARDDIEARHYESDVVHLRVKRIAESINNMSSMANKAYNSAELIAHPPENVVERKSSVPDCLVCEKSALPRPKRGLCQPCYDGFRRSGITDLAVYKAQYQERCNSADGADGAYGKIEVAHNA